MRRKKKDGRRNNGGYRPGAGRKPGTENKTQFKVGFRPQVLKMIDEQCETEGLRRRQVVERVVAEAISGYYGTPNPRIKIIIEASGLPIKEVIEYLLDKALSKDYDS